jgi:hypothetical protein
MRLSPPPLQDTFLFINTGKDLSLTNNPDGYGQIAITNRATLANFFNLLAHNSLYRFGFCDITFDYPVEGDSSLEKAIYRCRNLLFVSSLDKDSLIPPYFKVLSAIGEYQTYDNHFSKFRLRYHDSLKTIPLVMHEILDRSGKEDYHWRFQSLAPRYYIRESQLYDEPPLYSLQELGLLLKHLNKHPEQYAAYFANKIVVIGNFEADQSDTPIGKMSSPLVIINMYLSLRYGRDIISWQWILYMSTFLSVISYGLFYAEFRLPKSRLPKQVDSVFRPIILKLISWASACTFLALLSEFIFHLQFSISLLLAYLICVSWAKDYYKENINEQNA